METRVQRTHRFLATFLLLITFLLADCCFNHERQALLKFKAGVSDPSNRLDSWRGDECCNWAGIKCNNQTGYVIKLNLRNIYSYSSWDDPNYVQFINHSLSGEINPALLALSNLQYLDLSCNTFNEFPEFIGSFEKLEYLNLSSGSFYHPGRIPPQLGNLSQLQFLDLSYNGLPTSTDIWWLSHLTSLRHLDMSGVDLQNSTEWVQPLNKLLQLEVLVLDDNKLTHIPQSLPFLNFTSLRVLQLSSQDFDTKIPNWIFSLHGITDLNLEQSNFVGPFPDALQNLTSISKLVLDSNQLYGKIPTLHGFTKLTYLSLSNIPMSDVIDISEILSSFTRATLRRLEELIIRNSSLSGNLTRWAGDMQNLEVLDLSHNHLNGHILYDIGNLTNLVKLDLSGNSLTGSFTATHLGHLSKLKVLILDDNPITIVMETDWQPSFQLHTLSLRSCHLGSTFPAWLQNQVEIEHLYLQGTGIHDILPNWLWNLASLYDLLLTFNNIRGTLPESLENLTRIFLLDLSFNQLEGKIPSSFPDSLHAIFLNSNKFEKLPGTFEAPNLHFLNLANNSISGNIESYFCRMTELYYLDLSSNDLYGHLPNCFPNNLLTIDLSNNSLSGTIPGAWCRSGSLSVLQLNKNSMTGELPPTLRFCQKLTMLDLGDNRFHGEIPEWVGENLVSLQILRLHSNFFSGSIPSKLTLLHHLRVLDLANNYLLGHIPLHLDNLTAMIVWDPKTTLYFGSVPITLKSIDLTYLGSSIIYIASMDLSNNNLTGEIPDTIVALAMLLNLNLSHNHLTGTIPTQIGKMKSVESLDLHMNNLSGSIPQSMSALNSLGTLNLSYNNLSGSIPTGNQLQTLDNPSIYMGNPYLCGFPLETSCNSNGSYPPSYNNEKPGSDREKFWFYLFIEFGFVVGFLGLFFVMLFKRSWRYTYFKMVDNVFDRIMCLDH